MHVFNREGEIQDILTLKQSATAGNSRGVKLIVISVKKLSPDRGQMAPILSPAVSVLSAGQSIAVVCYMCSASYSQSGV